MVHFLKLQSNKISWTTNLTTQQLLTLYDSLRIADQLVLVTDRKICPMANYSDLLLTFLCKRSKGGDIILD